MLLAVAGNRISCVARSHHGILIMKPMAHSLTFLCLLAFVLALRMVGRDYYSKDLSRVMGKASEIRATEIQAGWKSRHFEEFNSEETKAAILEKAHKQEFNLSDL